jgi:hypothetical protein
MRITKQELAENWAAHVGQMSKAQIDAGRSAKSVAGGTDAWTAATLAAWGVPWPPPKGWKAALLKPAERRASRPVVISCAEGHSFGPGEGNLYWLHRPCRAREKPSPGQGGLKAVQCCHACDAELLRQAHAAGHPEIRQIHVEQWRQRRLVSERLELEEIGTVLSTYALGVKSKLRA